MDIKLKITDSELQNFAQLVAIEVVKKLAMGIPIKELSSEELATTKEEMNKPTYQQTYEAKPIPIEQELPKKVRVKQRIEDGQGTVAFVGDTLTLQGDSYSLDKFPSMTFTTVLVKEHPETFEPYIGESVTPVIEKKPERIPVRDRIMEQTKEEPPKVETKEEKKPESAPLQLGSVPKVNPTPRRRVSSTIQKPRLGKE